MLQVQSDDIKDKDVCQPYDVDPDEVANELADFSVAYRLLCSLVSLLLVSTVNTTALITRECTVATCFRGYVTSICDDACSVSTSGDNFNVQFSVRMKMKTIVTIDGDKDQSRDPSELLNNNFIKPLHQSSQPSGYLNFIDFP